MWGTGTGRLSQSGSFDRPRKTGFKRGEKPMETALEERPETALVAELATSATLVKIAINLAAQLVIADGGSMAKVRGILANAMPGEMIGPELPSVTPAAALGFDAAAARQLAGEKVRTSVQFIAETAAVTVVKQGIALKRN